MKTQDILGGLLFTIVGAGILYMMLPEYLLFRELTGNEGRICDGYVLDGGQGESDLDIRYTVEGKEYQYDDSNIIINQPDFISGDSVMVVYLSKSPTTSRIQIAESSQERNLLIFLGMGGLALIGGIVTLFGKTGIRSRAKRNSPRLKLTYPQSGVLKIEKTKGGAIREIGGLVIGLISATIVQFLFFPDDANDFMIILFYLFAFGITIYKSIGSIKTMIEKPEYKVDANRGYFEWEDNKAKIDGIDKIEVTEIHQEDSSNDFALKIRFAKGGVCEIDRDSDQETIFHVAEELAQFTKKPLHRV